MGSKKVLTLLLLIPMFLTVHFPSVTHAEDFGDVEPGDSYYVAITHLREIGIIDGYEDNTFRAQEKINRAEALKMITLATGLFNKDEIENSAKPENQPFTDVFAAAWYSRYADAAKKAGIIEGYSDGTFHPEETINLVEALKIFFSSHSDITLPETPENFYADAGENTWFSKYTSYAGEHGLINIYSDNTINTEQEMTRGYLAEIIYRTEKSLAEGYMFGKATWYGSAVQGSNTASGEIFDYNLFTAAHRTLPFGTMVDVTNLANGKTVRVKITDRGPFGPGRELDLSSGAFKEIASLGAGVINVQYKAAEPST